VGASLAGPRASAHRERRSSTVAAASVDTIRGLATESPGRGLATESPGRQFSVRNSTT
jgi:hypothetical protein